MVWRQLAAALLRALVASKCMEALPAGALLPKAGMLWPMEHIWCPCPMAMALHTRMRWCQTSDMLLQVSLVPAAPQVDCID